MNKIRCRECGAAIECCEFCDRDACTTATCFTCVQLETKVRIRDPHDHGG